MPRERRVALLAQHLMWDEGSLAFSYAAEKLQASLADADDLGDVESTVVDLGTDDPEAFLEPIREFRPSIVAASVYIWSARLFTRLAELVHRWDPSVPFVMGGPAARPSVLDLPPYAPFKSYITAVATGEGEQVIRDVAREHSKPDWPGSVTGLKLPSPLGWRQTGPVGRPVLDDYPSPYELGIAPRVDHGFLETFRGCPISCAFCQWGDERADRVYSADYLARHLRGFDDAGVERVHVLDAAFNLSPRAFHNLVAAEREVGALRKRHIVGHIYPSHLRDEHVEFLDGCGNADLAVGVQSFDAAVLKGLGRPFEMKRFERVIKQLAGRHAIRLEIILGLPGDDPKSFRETFERAIELGTSLLVFRCLALPDALLERAEDLDIVLDPETFQVKSCKGWTAEAIQEEWDYVCRVASKMPRTIVGDQWVEFYTPSDERRPDTGPQGARRVASETMTRLRDAVAVTGMGWSLTDARDDGERLILDLEAASNRLVLEATVAVPGRPHFAEHDGIAYSHRGALERGESSNLRTFIERLHRGVRPVLALEEQSYQAPRRAVK